MARRWRNLGGLLVLGLTTLAAGCSGPLGPGERIVAIRHAEKPAAGLGQLDCEGLNRALALPALLLARYGKPDAIFAPNPGDEVIDGGNSYSYVRPLATIEPTAVAAGLPVNSEIGFRDVSGLYKLVSAEQYAHALIFVAWEHENLNQFAQQAIAANGGSQVVVPDWPDNDYDRIYVLTASRREGKPAIDFRVDREDLNGLGSRCPGTSP